MGAATHPAAGRSELALLATCGVRWFRHPIGWHRVEPERGVYDWRETDRAAWCG